MKPGRPIQYILIFVLFAFIFASKKCDEKREGKMIEFLVNIDCMSVEKISINSNNLTEQCSEFVDASKSLRSGFLNHPRSVQMIGTLAIRLDRGGLECFLYLVDGEVFLGEFEGDFSLTSPVFSRFILQNIPMRD